MRKLFLLSLILIAGCRAKNSDNAPPLEHVTVSLSSVSFGLTYPGFTRNIPLTVKNTGQLNTTVTLSSLSSSVYSISSVPGSPVTLGPQEIMLVMVTFSPTANIEDDYENSFEITTTAGETPSFNLPIKGTATFGSKKDYPVSPGGDLGAISEPSEHDDDDVVFVCPGAAGSDYLMRYDVGFDHILSMQIDNIAQPALGRVGSKKVLLATGGANGVGDGDDTLVLVNVEADSHTTQEVALSPLPGVFGLSSDPAGRPVRIGEDCAAVITNGVDGSPGTSDDTVAIVNFNTSSVTHVVVGELDTTFPLCRPSVHDSGTIAIASPGANMVFGGTVSDDRVWMIQFDTSTGGDVTSSVVIGDSGLHKDESVFLVWKSGRAVQVRPGEPNNVVEITSNAEVFQGVSVPDVVGPIELLNVSGSNAELAVLGKGVDTIIGNGDDLVHYLTFTNFLLEIQGSAPFPNIDTTLSVIKPSIFPTGDVDPTTGLIAGAQLLGLAENSTSGGNGVLNFVGVDFPVVGPLNNKSILVSSTGMEDSGQPSFFDNKEWAALSCSTGDQVVFCTFRESTPQVGTFDLGAALNLDSSLVSRAVAVGNSVVVVLTGGAGGPLGGGDDRLVRIDLPIP